MTSLRSVGVKWTAIFCIINCVVSGNGRTAADDTYRPKTPIEFMMQTANLVSERSKQFQQRELLSLQTALLQADYIQVAKEVLDSGILQVPDFAADDQVNSNIGSLFAAEVDSPTLRQDLTLLEDNITTPSPDNITASDAPTTSAPTPPTPTVNETCANHTNYALEELTQGQAWALQLVDAAGKPSPNIIGLNLFWVGSYEECTGVVAPSQTNSSNDSVLFRGRYCTAVLPMQPTDARPLMAAVPPSGVRWGVCVPDSCTGIDVTLMLNQALATQNISQRVALTTCQAASLEYDTKAIAVLVVCGVFLLLMVCGTTLDVLDVRNSGFQVKQTDPLSEVKPDHDRSGVDQISLREEHGETVPLLRKNQTAVKPSAEVAKKILLAFSVYTNGKKILNASHSPGSITCIHGIRFLSMTWVILGHTFAFGLSTAGNFAGYLGKVMGLWTFQAIIGAPVSVDTFFLLSGLLVTYLVLKEMDKNKGKVNWFLFYFHRFWRLTPPYGFVLMVYVPLFRYFADGPNWPQQGLEVNYCKDSWWTNLLYVNNFVKIREMCMSWSWYMANDMQFYIVSPLLFLPLFKWRKVGVVLAGVWLLATMTAAGVIARVNDFPPSTSVGGDDLTKSFDYFKDWYIKPYCRFGPYIVGMLTGYALYITKCQVRMNLAVCLGGWAVATATALAAVYGLYDAPFTSDVNAFYNAGSHTAWSFCVAWVIFACATGHGGPVNSLLSWNAFIPLGRLTYMAYLVHPIIMNLYHFSSAVPFYMSHLHCAMLFLAFTVASFGVAFILSLAFEAPMMALEKVILPSPRKH